MRRSMVGAIVLGVALASAAGWAGATASANPHAGRASSAATAVSKAKPAAPVKRLDINSASKAQLETLPGIGKAEAEKIIAGRPYLSKADLATNKVIPTGSYLSIKDLIIAKPGKINNAKP